ncbi:hypothetical protein B0A49_02712 [Cryomyces minteri]|uniref:Alcohol dehydrogenase-like C-terminal domain-containing protein n=1 Tax=Cryomyces minteri TaxID=331657 RepID=A0A4U0XHZ0_9PEZI|nr:hypothetical protein B0A49_02712 [Cryomyces minteri]
MGVDARDDGLPLSRGLGADVVLDAWKGKDYVVQEARKAKGGRGVDAWVNVSDAKLAAATACAITRILGTVVQVALLTEVSIPSSKYVFRDFRVKGSFTCSQKEAEEMLDVVFKHDIKVELNMKLS